MSNLQVRVPAVAGTNFVAWSLPVGVGSQTVAAAVGDLAGNVGVATRPVWVQIVTNAAYAYSPAGCLSNAVLQAADVEKRLSLEWNSRYELMSVKTNGTLVERYTYDALGRRASIEAGGQTRWLVYDGQQVVAETDTAGAKLCSYVHGPGIDNAISMTVYGATTNTYYYLTDHLGTVHALADAAGTIVESYEYDAWGRVLGVYDANGAPLTESAVGNRILWQGREYSWKVHAANGGAGLYYFRARWYDPVTGRWLSNDPIGISGGLNQYVFCGNNPVNRRDPWGLCDKKKSWWPKWLTLGGITVAAENVWEFGGTKALPVIKSTTMGIGGMLLWMLTWEGDTRHEAITMSNPAWPHGVWPGDRGSEEWGRRKGIDPDRARGDFHDIKQGDPMSGATDDYGVDPGTGDVYDPEGNVIGNLDE